MKVARSISFDSKMIEKLDKEENASELVNNLVKAHYEKDVYAGWKKEQLDVEVRLCAEMNELQRKRELLWNEVKNGNC